MKKVILVLVFFFVILGLVACELPSPNSGLYYGGDEPSGEEKPSGEDPSGGDPVVPITPETKYLTVTEAVALANQAGEAGTAERQYVHGTVKSISNSTYGEMYITDGTTDLYVYGVYSSDGSIRYDALTEKPYTGDEVYLYGILKVFKGSPEIGAAWLQKMVSNQGETDLSEYTEVKIGQARSSEVDSKVIVEGVVAQITYANGMNPNGVFLVDETGSIYVYGVEIAGRVKVGQKVKVAGTKTLYILDSEKNDAAVFGYQGSIQLQDSIFVSASEGTFEFDKTSIFESTVKKMMETPLTDNITTSIFKVKAIVKEVPGVGFTNYYIDDLDGHTGSYCYSLCNGGDYAYLKPFDGKICEVYLSALNCKCTKSGTVYRFVPISVQEITDFSMTDKEIAKFALEYYAKSQFLKEYNSDPAMEVLTSVSNEYIPFSDVSIAYESLNTELISFAVESEKLIMHINSGNQVVKVKMEATYKETKAELTIDINVNTKEIPASITIAEAIAAEDGTEVTLRGIVMSGTVNQTGFYLNDGTGVIAVLTSSETIKNIALGNEIVIKGIKKHKTNDSSTWIGQIHIEGATLEVNLLGNHEFDTSTFINNLSFDEVKALASEVLVDHTAEVYVAKCYINKVEGSYSTNFYLSSTADGKDIYLYAGSGSQYSIYNSLVGKEITVTFALVNWNSKSPYRACIISATDGETTVLNNYNFR